jgi:hypothetical protein
MIDLHLHLISSFFLHFFICRCFLSFFTTSSPAPILFLHVCSHSLSVLFLTSFNILEFHISLYYWLLVLHYFSCSLLFSVSCKSYHFYTNVSIYIYLHIISPFSSSTSFYVSILMFIIFFFFLLRYLFPCRFHFCIPSLFC